MLRVIQGGRDQVHPRFTVEDAATAQRVRQRLVDLGVPIAEQNRERRMRRVPRQAILELVDLVPVREGDPGSWNRGAVRAILESFSEQTGADGPIYIRGLDEAPTAAGWVRGRLSGDEVGIIRDASGGVPALALMFLGPVDSPTGWYPTLVLPPDGATYVVNPF